MPVAQGQTVELTFRSPGAKSLRKLYDTDALLKSPRIFVFDAQHEDVYSDVDGDPWAKFRSPTSGRNPYTDKPTTAPGTD